MRNNTNTNNTNEMRNINEKLKELTLIILTRNYLL